MVCPTCGLDNEPDAAVCARYNSALTPAATAAYPAPPPSPVRAGRNRIPLIAGVSVLLPTLAVAAGVYLRPAATEKEAAPRPARTTPTTPPTTKAADPRTLLTPIDAVLTDSVASRG